MDPHSTPKPLSPRCLTLACALLIPAAQADPQTVLTDMDASTVRVLCVDPAGDRLGTGSGFVLGTGAQVATNWHVVACTGSGGVAAVDLARSEAQTFKAEVQAKDEGRDLAVLRLDRPLGRPAVRFASVEGVAKLDTVIAYGFPGAADAPVGGGGDLFDPSPSQGKVARIYPRPSERDQPRLIQHNASISPGNSGGPLFDAYGRVVGVNTMKSLTEVLTPGADGTMTTQRVSLAEIGWAVASDDLLPLLDRLGISYRLERGRVGALGDLWQREPLITTALALILTLALAGVALGTSRRGRAVLREGVTRALGRAPSGPLKVARPPPAQPAPAQGRQARQPILRALAGPYTGAEVSLAEGPVAIGRDPALAQLVLPPSQGMVSKRHALVSYDPSGRAFTLEDCWSSHGTFLNGNRIPPGQGVALKPGDRFHLATPAVAFEVALS